MLEQINRQEPGNSSPAVRICYRNRSVVAELVGYISIKDRLLYAKVDENEWRNKSFAEKNR